MIATLDRAAARPEARAFFGLEPDRPTLLVTGGSQGAARLNMAVWRAAGDVLGCGGQVLHVLGPKGSATPSSRTGGDLGEAAKRYVTGASSNGWTSPTPPRIWFCPGPGKQRGGGCRRRPSGTSPLPIGNGEQRLNAEPIVAAGGGLLIADADLDAAWVADHVPALLTDPERLGRDGRGAAARLIPRDADERLARLVMGVVGEHPRRKGERR